MFSIHWYKMVGLDNLQKFTIHYWSITCHWEIVVLIQVTVTVTGEQTILLRYTRLQYYMIWWNQSPTHNIFISTFGGTYDYLPIAFSHDRTWLLSRALQLFSVRYKVLVTQGHEQITLHITDACVTNWTITCLSINGRYMLVIKYLLLQCVLRDMLPNIVTYCTLN